MKVILVIDTPNACWECMLCGRGIKERFCIARIYETGNSYDCDIKDLNKIESWCPLKPLPEKKNTSKLQDFGDSQIVWTDKAIYQNEGWNACIDTILGDIE